jgi:aminopeptidase N
MKLLPLLCLVVSFAALATRPSDDNLTRKFARQRRSQVKAIKYDLYFEFEKGRKKFRGVTTLNVSLATTKRPLSIDTLYATISSVTVNGKRLERYLARKGSFDIPAKALAPESKIEVIYEATYSRDGHGFKRVVDPEDGAEYLYSDFEPYYAHWLFPCLDQPDLKATYEVSVKAPSDWRIVHNDLVKSESRDGDHKLTTFERTKPFSTYLFFLGAGPWEEWTDNFNGLPLVIHARKSMAKYVDHEKIFDTTKKGLRFFNEYFAYPYPFPKYGQIFVPDFAAGAMENPGAVTFNEQRSLFRGAVPVTAIENRDNTILHEMAHMWFGDLVTMEWWNDLWLNESFATYAATLAQGRELKTSFADMDFLESKNWGYWQDQLVTTHPIEAPIPDVRAAKGIFDGITYAKGGSALKQLHFYVGEAGFRDGLREYFKTFAFKNTQRRDFTGAIAKASGVDLDGWTKNWLQTAGPNQVEFSFSCGEGKISSAVIRQTRSVSRTLSPHRTRLALYRKQNEELVFVKTADVKYEGPETVASEIIGTDCPDFVFPNAGDYDYALFGLDPRSLKLAKLALTKLPDALSRYGVWSILLQMVRDQKLAPGEMTKLTMEALATESDPVLVGLLTNRYSVIRNQYFYYLGAEERAALAPSYEKVFWDRVQNSSPGSSLQISFFDYFVSTAQTEESQTRLYELLLSKKGPKGIELGADRRWAIIRILAQNNHPKALELIDAEAKNDPSTLGKRLAFAAKVAVPNEASKRAYFRSLQPKELPYSDFREATDSFFMNNYPDLNRRFLRDFFEQLKKTDWTSNDDVVDVYFEHFYPFEECSKDNEALSKSYMTQTKLTNLAKKGWLEAHDELSRCVRIRMQRQQEILTGSDR